MSINVKQQWTKVYLVVLRDAVKMILTVFQVATESTNRTSIIVPVIQLVQMVVPVQLMNARIVFFDLFFGIGTLLVFYQFGLVSRPSKVGQHTSSNIDLFP